MRRRGHDSWQLRVYLGPNPDTGKQRWAARTVHGSRRYAQAQLALLVDEAQAARTHAGTVTDLLQRWFTAASPNWAVSTVRETRSLIRCHLDPHLGYIPVAKLTTADIDDFYAHLRRAGGRDGRPLAPGTVHRVHVVLHRALTQALRWEWIWLNPASHASPPRVLPAEIHPPSPVQVGRLLALVRDADPSFYTYLRLAATTGARRSQLLALRWSDIDVAHSAIGFSRALVEGPDGPVLQPTKNRRTYRVALDQETLATVIEHARRRAERGADAGVETGDGFVFSDEPTGRRPWQPNWVTKRFIRYRQQAGPDQFRLHDLRHFMATTMLAAGVPVPVVSERLCHARTSTTVNIYAHAMPGADRDAANLLADLLSPGHAQANRRSRHRSSVERYVPGRTARRLPRNGGSRVPRNAADVSSPAAVSPGAR